MDDLEHDEANEEMMKSMGFAAFGSTDNRPKQQAPGQQNQKQKLPPRPPATGANAQIQGQPGPGGRMETFVRDRGFGGGQRGGRGRGEDGPSKRQKFDNDDEGGFSGSRGRGKNKWEGFEQGGQGDEEWFYSPSFVEDPWANLMGPDNDFIPLDPYIRAPPSQSEPATSASPEPTTEQAS